MTNTNKNVFDFEAWCKNYCKLIICDDNVCQTKQAIKDCSAHYEESIKLLEAYKESDIENIKEINKLKELLREALPYVEYHANVPYVEHKMPAFIKQIQEAIK